MPLNFKNDTPSTSPLGPNDRLFGAPNGSGAETQSYSREAILNYLISALAAVASSGSASDLSTGTLPLGRLHAWLQDISSIDAPAVGQVIAFDGVDFIAQSVTNVAVGGLAAANNLSELTNAATARGNIGLGTADTPTFNGVNVTSTGNADMLFDANSGAQTAAVSLQGGGFVFRNEDGDVFIDAMGDGRVYLRVGDGFTEALSVANSGAVTIANLDSITTLGTDAVTVIEAALETAIDTLANLTSIQGRTITLADAGTNAFLGWDDAAGAYENLTASEATAILNAFVGDSGSGGTKGLVPAPASGDAAARKYLRADGSWSDVQTSALNAVAQGRLSLTSGTAVTATDVTGATTLYYVPLDGAVISLYDGAAWQSVTFTEKSLKATDTQTGTTSSAAATITGLTDTSQLIVGMEVSGTGVPGSRTIASIDSATQITMSGNGDADGSASITFKLPASTNYDVWGYISSSTLKLEWSAAWTNATTRSTAITTQNGIDVKSGQTTRRLLGTVRTTLAGVLEDSKAKRFLSNRYNDTFRTMAVHESTVTWTYGTATLRQANANTANQLDYVCCVARPVWAQVVVQVANSTSTARYAGVNIGVDSTSSPSAELAAFVSCTDSQYQPASAFYAGTPGLGRHYLAWLEKADAGGGDSQTFHSYVPGFAEISNCGIVGAISA